MLRPYERVLIPDWCPDQLDSSTQFHTPKRLKWGSGSKYG